MSVTGYSGVRQRVEVFVSLMECCGISLINSVGFLKVFIEMLVSGIFLLFGYLPFFCRLVVMGCCENMQMKANESK